MNLSELAWECRLPLRWFPWFSIIYRSSHGYALAMQAYLVRE